MSKTVLMIGLAVGVGLGALHGATAEAGTWAYVRPPGTWWYYGTIDGCATIGSVPNPDTHPAQFACQVQITAVQTLCENPQNHNVSPGEAATKALFIAEHQLDQADLDKKEKGKANACVAIDEAQCDPALGPVSPLCDDGLCVNPRWHLKEVLTTEFVATCTTEQCTGDDPDPCAETVVKDTQVCKCTLPAGYSVENPPAPCADPLHPDPTCTAYICSELDENGVPTGNLCHFE